MLLERADVLDVGGHSYLLAPVSSGMLDWLSVFDEHDGREPDCDLEPDCDAEPDDDLEYENGM